MERHSAARIPFATLAGTGNSFVLVDARQEALRRLNAPWRDLARTLCDPRTGEGTDGLLVVEPSRAADLRMRIFNPDGSEPSMCGNGIRCLALYAHRRDPRRSTILHIETRAGIKRAQMLSGGRVRVDVGAPRVVGSIDRLRVGARVLRGLHLIDAGVPHLICWVPQVAAVPVERVGRALRAHRRFQPEGVNVDFVQVREVRDAYVRSLGMVRRRVRVTMRTYERGVEGETRACGTGAVAAAAALAGWLPFGGWGRGSERARLDVDVRVPGGILRVQLAAKSLGNRDEILLGRALLEGEARQLSTGTFAWNGRRRV